MYLPNREAAIVEMAKLRDHCLSSDHPVGKHKARVFASALGFSPAEAPRLREMLLAAALTNQAVEGGADQYGQRYTLDFTVYGLDGLVSIRSAWIVRTDEDAPRLVTCHIL